MLNQNPLRDELSLAPFRLINGELINNG